MAKTMNSIQAKTIDEYIAAFPKEVQNKMQQLREEIHKTVPDLREDIKYGIPTFILNGNLVHFGGFKNHIGFYPAPSGIEAFKKELSKYEGAKGSVQFPLDVPLPLPLIRKIVKFRAKENLAKISKPKK